jgi:hypothetical protein
LRCARRREQTIGFEEHTACANKRDILVGLLRGCPANKIWELKTSLDQNLSFLFVPDRNCQDSPQCSPLLPTSQLSRPTLSTNSLDPALSPTSSLCVFLTVSSCLPVSTSPRISKCSVHAVTWSRTWVKNLCLKSKPKISRPKSLDRNPHFYSPGRLPGHPPSINISPPSPPISPPHDRWNTSSISAYSSPTSLRIPHLSITSFGPTSLICLSRPDISLHYGTDRITFKNNFSMSPLFPSATYLSGGRGCLGDVETWSSLFFSRTRWFCEPTFSPKLDQIRDQVRDQNLRLFAQPGTWDVVNVILLSIFPASLHYITFKISQTKSELNPSPYSYPA